MLRAFLKGNETRADNALLNRDSLSLRGDKVDESWLVSMLNVSASKKRADAIRRSYSL